MCARTRGKNGKGCVSECACVCACARAFVCVCARARACVRVWQAYIKNMKERMDRMGKEGIKNVTGSMLKLGSQTKALTGSQSMQVCVSVCARAHARMQA